MFKNIIFLIVVPITLSLGSDFETEFTRLITADPEQQLYGTSNTVNSNDRIAVNFTQKLDHFRPADKNTWEQRVLILKTHYDKRQRGPFIIYFFGNEEASMDWLRDSRIMSYAKDFKALVIGLEHRFYGESRPFEDTSVENLNYLNVHQALADIAYFIGSVNQISVVPENTKWIAFGGFYGGSLAAWARMRYPHLVHGAVASSALISIKSDFPDYLESVKNSYYSYNSTCAKNIKLAIEQLDDALKTEEGRAEIFKRFRLCNPLVNTEDVNIFKNLIQELVSKAVEKNYTYRYSMETVCDLLNRPSILPKDSMANVNGEYMSLENARCWYVDKKTIIPIYQNKNYNERNQNERLWTWQLCTQFGFNLPSKNSVEMFGENESGVVELGKFCPDIFGPGFNQQTIDDGVEQMNMEFGASLFNASNTVFVSGSLNPWGNAGITKKIENAPYEVIYIDGITHRADLEPSSRYNPNLNNGIRQIKDILKSWLA